MCDDVRKENDLLKEQLSELNKKVGESESALPSKDNNKPETKCASIVVLGASGDLAKKMTFPALFNLYCLDLLPKKVNIYGYARSKLSQEEWHKKISEKFKGWEDKREDFLSKCKYFNGQYDSVEDFAKLNKELEKEEDDDCTRLFYLAVPPETFYPASKAIKESAMKKNGSTRIVIEKPYGRDTDSAKLLSTQLASLFSEDQIYRIDHYLGKEMVQNIMALRFANVPFEQSINRHNVAAIFIDFKEPFGIGGRGGYFDKYGMIRDVMQNHLIQVMALLAMECPTSIDSKEMSLMKTKLLKETLPIDLHDVVTGQYIASKDGKTKGYKEDETVPDDSNTETYATIVLRVNNDRWSGVPFIMRAGKGLSEKSSVVRIQFHESKHPIYPGIGRNELVLKISPEEGLYFRYNNKVPGMENKLAMTELCLSYKEKFEKHRVPDAYERLLYEVLQGDHSVFVRTDEVVAAWEIFTPMLRELEKGKKKPVPYRFGSKGPEQADQLIAGAGFNLGTPSIWKPIEQDRK